QVAIARPQRSDASRFGPRQRSTAASVGPPVHLADHLRCVGDGARKRNAVQQDVILAMAVRWIPEDAKADVSDDPHRLRRLAGKHRGEEVSSIEAETTFVAGVR